MRWNKWNCIIKWVFHIGNIIDLYILIGLWIESRWVMKLVFITCLHTFFLWFCCFLYVLLVCDTFLYDIIIIFRGFKRCANAKHFYLIVCIFLFSVVISIHCCQQKVFFVVVVGIFVCSICIQLRQKQQENFNILWKGLRKSLMWDLVVHLMFSFWNKFKDVDGP